MKPLTKKQQKILAFIENRLSDNDPPSQREIAEHFGLAQNAVYQLIGYLKQKEYLADTGGHRGLRLSESYLEQIQQAEGIPLIGQIAAGEPILAEQNIEGNIDLKKLFKPTKDAFILKVRGDSMVDEGIMDGDYVVVQPVTAIWRRIRLIPFNIVIPGSEQDKTLLSKLEVEWPGIFNRLLHGCMQWLKSGSLQEPEDVKNATFNYRQEQDPLKDFINDCCLIDGTSVTPVAKLKEAFEAWKEKSSIDIELSSQRFNSSLVQRGCLQDSQWFEGKTQRVWVGIKINSS